MRKAVLLAVSCCAALQAQAAAWRPLPGVDDIEVDATSIQMERGTVSAWLRVVGNPDTARALAGPLAKPAFRTLVHAQFDCRHGRMRALATEGQGATGAPVYMSSVLGPTLAIADDARLAWPYHALCELARDPR